MAAETAPTSTSFTVAPATLDWLGCATFRLTLADLVVFLDAYIDRVPSAPTVVETIGNPQHHASRIFTRIPAPVRRGTTNAAVSASRPRRSATSPRTSMRAAGPDATPRAAPPPITVIDAPG